MPSTDLPIRAATETLLAHGITPDRCDVLQDGSTLVLRLTEDLVARVVQDRSGPRQGTEWFARENAIAQHLTFNGAPVIPLHPSLPPGPHEHLGYPMNFWKFVTAVDTAPDPTQAGRKLHQCHEVMRSFPEPLPALAILTESLDILKERELFPSPVQQNLRDHLVRSIQLLGSLPHQPLHGDAHMGNLMNTTCGLLWTDWEDTFSGPVEWDLASVICNARLLDNDLNTETQVLGGYEEAGGRLDHSALDQCIIARVAVICAWYPILYGGGNPERQAKLERRLAWLGEQ